MNKKFMLLPLLIAGSTCVYAGDDLSYSYIEVDYINLNIEGYDNNKNLIEEVNDGDGWGVQASYGFSNNIFSFAGYSSTQSDIDVTDDLDQTYRSNTDIDRFSIGIGYHMPIADQTDLVFSAAYADIDVGGFDFGQTNVNSINDLQDDSSDGYILDAGLRSQIMTWMEGSAGLRYTDVESVSNVSFIGNLLFEVSPAIGINLGVDVGEELTTWALGARYSL